MIRELKGDTPLTSFATRATYGDASETPLQESQRKGGQGGDGRSSVQRRRFWSIAGTETPKREPKAKAEKPATAKKEPTAKPTARGKPATTKTAKKAKAPAKKKSAKPKSASKGKAHPAAAKGDASYGCGACGEAFPTQKKAVAHALTHTS